MITLLDEKVGHLSLTNLIIFPYKISMATPYYTTTCENYYTMVCVYIITNKKACIAQTYYKHEYIVT
jgi:hypothetical protein